jgi:8-oxo-dGTP pyrophosphatase MutT (NUDIX family)
VVDVLVFRAVQRGWQVLALQRSANVRCPGAWEMVHGKVEPGEALPAAARRECVEETGLKPELLLSIGMHPFYVVPTGKVQLAGVFAAVVDGNAAVKIGEEHVKHAWLTISAAARRYVWPHERRVLTDAYALLRTPEVHDVLRVP